MLLSNVDRLTRARQVLERGEAVPAEFVSEPILQSWQRCLDAGLDPTRPPPIEVVAESTLREARQRRDLLRRLALGEMENLYQQIAGTNFMIAFAAPDGLLLDSIADPSFSAEASDGILAGVLDASSDCRSRQDHTRVLVAMAATQIENGMFREHHRSDVLIAFHNRLEYLHTLSAGLLALDPGGMLLAANAQARFLLHGLSVRRGSSFAELFTTKFGDLLLACRQDVPQMLQDRIGSMFAARVKNLRHARPIAVPPPAPSAAPTPSPPGFIADDPAIVTVLHRLQTATQRKLPILVRGETGTGKEQVARHLHRASGRTGAFVPVNCAALPDALVEAELFGHADGAFTGARRGGAPGLVREADGGTLFLDEIGNMKMSLQSVLLRLLDDWTVRPVGGGRPRTVDVLLIAATNVALPEATAAGRFRADLYYRLAIIDVALPPLRERTDFAALTRSVLAAVAPGWRIEDDAIAALIHRPWPGNIRELRATLAGLTLGGASGVICAGMLTCAPPASAACIPRMNASSLRENVKFQIREALSSSNGNVSETARRLGVSRNTVYRALLGQA